MSAYLLLRENRKTGPHTLDELLSMDLTSMDLIWVEGQSQRWKHPAELGDFSSCALPGPGSGLAQTKRAEVLPGIRFRFPAYESTGHPWGPVPTLAMLGLDLFMAPPTRQWGLSLPTEGGDDEVSLFSVLPLSEVSSWVCTDSGNGNITEVEQSLASTTSIRASLKASGKFLRRSRKKYPHHLALSDVLTLRSSSSFEEISAGWMEGGFHIEFD